MQFLYGYDVAAELRQDTPYDEVVRALGGAGETVAGPGRGRAGAGPRVRRRACPTWSTCSPTRRSPTRAPPPVSEPSSSRARSAPSELTSRSAKLDRAGATVRRRAGGSDDDYATVLADARPDAAAATPRSTSCSTTRATGPSGDGDAGGRVRARPYAEVARAGELSSRMLAVDPRRAGGEGCAQPADRLLRRPGPRQGARPARHLRHRAATPAALRIYDRLGFVRVRRARHREPRPASSCSRLTYELAPRCMEPLASTTTRVTVAVPSSASLGLGRTRRTAAAGRRRGPGRPSRRTVVPRRAGSEVLELDPGADRRLAGPERAGRAHRRSPPPPGEQPGRGEHREVAAAQRDRRVRRRDDRERRAEPCRLGYGRVLRPRGEPLRPVRRAAR